MSAVTCGGGERGLERRRGDALRRAGLPPSPGRGVGLGPPCRQDGSPCPRKVRNAVSGQGAWASQNAQRSPAMPEGGQDRLRRTPGPRESEATTHTLSRGNAFARFSGPDIFNPMGNLRAVPATRNPPETPEEAPRETPGESPGENHDTRQARHRRIARGRR